MKITRPGLSDMQDGAMIVVYSAAFGFCVGVVSGIVLAVVGGCGLAMWYGMK